MTAAASTPTSAPTSSPTGDTSIGGAPTGGAPTADGTRLATFGAGCFWGVEAAFRDVPGVADATVGYLGGTMAHPTYKDVCTGRTGHAEVVQLQYAAAEVSYDRLLDLFWQMHDPTTLNRQGWDVGTQYRSAIFFHDAEQEAAAQASKEALQSGSKKRIVTEIAPASTFYPAEDYHQRYLEKQGLASCHVPSAARSAAASETESQPSGRSLWDMLRGR